MNICAIWSLSRSWSSDKDGGASIICYLEGSGHTQAIGKTKCQSGKGCRESPQLGNQNNLRMSEHKLSFYLINRLRKLRHVHTTSVTVSMLISAGFMNPQSFPGCVAQFRPEPHAKRCRCWLVNSWRILVEHLLYPGLLCSDQFKNAQEMDYFQKI
jgi:hypothetical protein